MAKTASETRRQFNGGKTAPREACIFTCPQGAVQFAAGDDVNGRFSIVAYDGSVTKHWYWGNFAIDLAGLSFLSDPLPILNSHYTSDRIGVTTEQSIGKKVTASGRFLGNASAQELRKDMQDGFPMQASLSGRPSIIEQIEDGASAKVNGHTLKGPGAIWRQAAIDEISMCVFGALNGTQSTAFADHGTEQIEFSLLQKENPMGTEEKAALTAESLKADYPEIHKAIYDSGQVAGAAMERNRFAGLQKACGDDTALLADCFTAGLTVADALAKRNERLAADLNAARAALAGPGKARDAATNEFISQPAPAAAPAAFDEAGATDVELEAHFAATPDLRDRFSSAKAYVAHVRHPSSK